MPNLSDSQILGAQAGINLGTSAINGLLSFGMAHYQNKLAIQNWKMQNEYNSPKNQMARFAEAGLNPNLIYGSGNPGNASSAPDASNVGQVQFNEMQLANMLMQLRSNAADVKLKEQEYKNRFYETEQNMIRASLGHIDRDAIIAYILDKTNETTFHSFGLERTLDEQERKFLRMTPNYMKLQRQSADVSQALETLSILQHKDSILNFQDTNMKEINDLLHMDVNNMNAGSFINSMFRLLLVLAGRNLSNF